MRNESRKKIKTFPLDIHEDLHKALKVSAIEEGKTLHSLIIETLTARIQEQPGAYHAKPREGNAK